LKLPSRFTFFYKQDGLAQLEWPNCLRLPTVEPRRCSLDMRMYSWYLRAIASACFAVVGVFASERVTSYRSRLFRHADHGHEHHEVRHFLQDTHHGVTLHGERPSELSDRFRRMAPQYDMNTGNLVSLNLDSRVAFGHVGLVPHGVYRSSAGFSNNEFTELPYGDLGTGMTSLFAVEEAAPGAGSPFVLGDLNMKDCPSGTVPITDANTCTSASTYFQKNFDGADSKTNRPPGCYIAGDMRGLNLNQDANGAADPAARPVCQATLQQAPLPSPEPQSVPAPMPAPAPAPQPMYQGGGGCSCQCPGGGCGCGCGSAPDLTTLIPIPLVPSFPAGTTAAPAALAPPASTTATALPATTAAAAPPTTAMPTATTAAAVVPAAAENGTEAGTAEAGTTAAAAAAEAVATTTAAAAADGVTTTAPAAAAAGVTTLAATTTAAANASFAEEPALILESVPINGLNSWQGSSHHPSSLLDMMFGS